jgi:hypothetical protein
MTPETEQEIYQAVMKRIEGLMGAEPGTPEGAELDFLTTVAESYEGGTPLFHDPKRRSKDRRA